MSRTLDAAHRTSLEEPHGEDQSLMFLEITHSSLSAPIRVVSDTGTENGVPVNWQYGGNNYQAFPFELTILTDTDDPPRGELTIANINQTVGEAIRDLQSPPSLTLTIIPTSEFNTSVNPRVPLEATPSVIYSAPGLTLREIEADAIAIRGVIVSIDDTAEPYPALVATQALFPGMYR